MSTRHESDDPSEAIWRVALTEPHPGRFSRWPSSVRCTMCGTPFAGISGRIAYLTGRHPSRLNPHICNYCDEFLPPGGVEIDVAVIFADVRGSTELAEQMTSREFTALMNRMYDSVTSVLIRRRAVIGSLTGDGVMAFFAPINVLIPGKSDFQHNALGSALEIFSAVGYGSDPGPWVPLAIGLESGLAFVGKVGREGVYNFTALGDTVNTAARLQEHAVAGEILLGERIYEAVSDEYRELEAGEILVQGKSTPLTVRHLRLGEPEDVLRPAG